VVFYDSEYRRLGSFEIPSMTVEFGFTTPINTKYIRCPLETIRLDKAQINLGNALLDYEPYYINLKDTFLSNIKLPNSVSNAFYVTPEKLTGWYKAPTVEGYDAGSHYSDSVTLDDVYSVYDTLVTTNPNYVTKTTLGNDSTNTYPIYKYEFKPEEVET